MEKHPEEQSSIIDAGTGLIDPQLLISGTIILL